jgi:hypothetical protein
MNRLVKLGVYPSEDAQDLVYDVKRVYGIKRIAEHLRFIHRTKIIVPVGGYWESGTRLNAMVSVSDDSGGWASLIHWQGATVIK